MTIAIIVILILIIIFMTYKHIQQKMELYEIYTAEQQIAQEYNTSDIVQERMTAIFYPIIYLN